MRKLLFVLLFAVSVFSQSGWDSLPIPINASANPGAPNEHYNFNFQRLVTINGISWVLCAEQSAEEVLLKSMDGGVTWVENEMESGAYNSALMTGADSLVFWFQAEGNNMYLYRFRYDATSVERNIIFGGTNFPGENTHYNTHSATVDSNGVMYCVYHTNSTTSQPDSIFCSRSVDTGKTWIDHESAFLVKGTNPAVATDTSFGYMQVNVTDHDVLVCSYSSWGSLTTSFSFSTDSGETWTQRLITDTSTANGQNNYDIYSPCILPYEGDTIFVFGQSQRDSSGVGRDVHGLVMNVTYDLGLTWSGWKNIDSSNYIGYSDPSVALTSDKHIVLNYRSGRRPDLIGESGGDQCRQAIAYSDDAGATWTFPNDYFYTTKDNPTIEDTTERTSAKFNTRYQTWHNYGGRLEWKWDQHTGNGANRVGYFGYNDDIQIYNIMAAPELPNITSIDPDTGIDKGGYTVTIAGTNFKAAGGIVKIEDDTLTDVVWGNTSITGTMPAMVYGTYDLIVIDSVNQIDSLINGFRYIQTITDTIKSGGGGGAFNRGGFRFSPFK